MAGFVAASAGIYGVGAAITKVGRDTIGFDRAMRNVNSIAQLNEGQFGRLEKSVLKLAGKTAQAPQALAEGLYDLVSSGFDSGEALAVLESSAKAATAGLTTTETSAAAVAAVLNAYKRPAKDAAEVSDTLFRIVDKGVISFEALANNIGPVLPSAATLGVGIDELGASIATLTKQGVPVEETMTSINSALTALFKPSKGMTAALEQLGAKGAKALIEDTGGLQQALEALIGTTDGSQESIGKLFNNQRALRGVFALTGKNAKGAREDVKALEEATGSTDRALEQQRKSWSFQWNQMSAAVDAAAIRIGLKAIPKMMSAVKEIGGIFKDDDLDLGEKIGQSLDVVGKHLAPLGRTLSQAFEAAVPKVADAAAAAAPKVAQAFIRGFMDAGVWGKLAIGGLIASKLRGGNMAGALAGAGRSSGQTFGRSTSDAAATYIGGPGFAKMDKALRGAGARMRSIGKTVLGFSLAAGIADGVTAEGLDLGQRVQQAFSTFTFGLAPSAFDDIEENARNLAENMSRDIQSAFQRGNWKDLDELARRLDYVGKHGDKALDPLVKQFQNSITNLRLLRGAMDNLPGKVKSEFLLLDEEAQNKIASLGSRLIVLGKTETVAKILASDGDAQQKIAALKRALKSIPDEKVNINVVEHRQTRGGGRARGQGPGARTSGVRARSSLLFQDDADLRSAQQERDDLDAEFERIDQRRERASIVRRTDSGRLKGVKDKDERKRIREDIKDARRELKEFDADVRRSNQRSRIDLRIEGIEKVRAAKDAIKDVREGLQDVARDAASQFRAGLERNIDSTLTAQLAAIGNSPEAQELRNLIAGQDADGRRREDTEQAKALTEAQKALEPAAARLERAKASGNQRFIDVAQAAFDELRANVVAAEQAISDTARQRRIDALQTQIADRENAANAEADIARASLDQQEADYAASLNAQLGTLAGNLEARRVAYSDFVAQVNAILSPLGLGFEGSADQEAAFEVTVEPAPSPRRRPRRRRRRRAHGGPVTAGLAYTVGEEGEEEFVPRVGGRIIPHTGRGGDTYNVTVNNMGRGLSPAHLTSRLAWKIATASA